MIVPRHTIRKRKAFNLLPTCLPGLPQIFAWAKPGRPSKNHHCVAEALLSPALIASFMLPL